MRPISEIAREIRTDMLDKGGQGKFPYAWPYLRAMLELNNVREMYGSDPASHVVRYFLSNVTTWRGETARRIKAELKAMVL